MKEKQGEDRSKPANLRHGFSLPVEPVTVTSHEQLNEAGLEELRGTMESQLSFQQHLVRCQDSVPPRASYRLLRQLNRAAHLDGNKAEACLEQGVQTQQNEGQKQQDWEIENIDHKGILWRRWSVNKMFSVIGRIFTFKFAMEKSKPHLAF